MLGKSSSSKIAQELRSWVGDLWADALGKLKYHSFPKGSEFHPVLVESVERLERKFKPEELGTGAADLYFHPLNWLNLDEQEHKQALNADELAIFYVLETLLYLHPPDDLAERFIQRLNTIIQHPRKGAERKKDAWSPHSHYPSDLDDLGRLIKNMDRSEAMITYLSRFLGGNFNVEVFVSQHKDLAYYKKAYEVYSRRLPLRRFMEYLHLHVELPYELFREALEQNNDTIGSISWSARYWREHREAVPQRYHIQTDYADSFLELTENYIDRYALEFAEEKTPERLILLKHMVHLSGSRWLIKAAEIHRDFELGKLMQRKPVRSSKRSFELRGIRALTIHLLEKTRDLVPEDPADYQSLVEQLQTFPTQTLRCLLPVEDTAREPILDALGWQQGKPLITLLFALGKRAYPGPYGPRDIPNSPDPASGAVDLKYYKKARELAGEELYRELLGIYYDASNKLDNTIVLLQAAEGEGREKILKHLETSKKRRNQKMIKAYGLLPLEEGDKEVFERYLTLQSFWKDTRQAGPEKQANERGAIKTALYHLAQVGGYPDVMRLEWDMEGRLATEVVPVGKQWEVDDYHVELQLSGSDPDLVIIHNDKRLKSVPKAVRASDQYPLIRASVEEIREQARRFRSFFEDMMSMSKEIAREDLLLLNRMPVPSFMLSQLILQTSKGELGLYRPEDIAVEPLDGSTLPIQEPVMIAHPVHLQEQDQLAAWQRLLVKRRMVQPFKQAFRELYLITPAEREARTYTNRFAGHVIDGGIAAKLFQARNWDFDRGESPLPQKLFPDLGFRAHFSFPDAGNYWSSDFSVTSDQIKFLEYPYNVSEGSSMYEEKPLPLTEIPPTIFSEVMRDADLVVSVARLPDKEFTSRESVKKRVELVEALLVDLGLEGVHFEDHFAYVQGKLAKYRVHMGSATIHIEPAGYLCVMPERWGKKHKDAFLPFSDADDDKTIEVISKIFLLMNDDKIKDKSIRRQIERSE
jgi:hypothetical protein